MFKPAPSTLVAQANLYEKQTQWDIETGREPMVTHTNDVAVKVALFRFHDTGQYSQTMTVFE